MARGIPSVSGTNADMRLHRFLSPTPVALLLFALAVLVPVATMVVRSFQVWNVHTSDGTVYEAAGDVVDTPNGIAFSIQARPGAPRVPIQLAEDEYERVERVFSTTHYETVFGDARTVGLLRNSALMALGGSLFAMLFGLPVAWVLARTALPGARLLGALCLGPAILPPFFIALGGARSIQAFLIQCFGLTSGALQIWNASIVFGCVLFPFVVLLVGPALAAVPAGPVEAARMLGGRRAAWRHVVLPAVLPSVLGAFVLCFVFAVSDFTVPDLLGFMLPAGGTPSHIYATDVYLQWKAGDNAGRAVATGAPFLVVTILLIGLCAWCLRRSPVLAAGDAGRPRPRIALGPLQTVGAYAIVGLVLFLSLGLPLGGIASWASSGETSASGTSADAKRVKDSGSLFEFTKALDKTEGIREQRTRWFKISIAAALLALVIAVPLARAATRGGRWPMFGAALAGAIPLAVPGLVLSVGTKLLWTSVEADRTVLQPALVLAGKYLPFALLAAWLALRSVRRGHEESAAMLGAGPGARALRIWGPASLRGILAGAVLVLIMALRDYEAVLLIEDRIYPVRLYTKIHFSRLADEANLLLLYLLYLLIPALLVAALLSWKRRDCAF